MSLRLLSATLVLLSALAGCRNSRYSPVEPLSPVVPLGSTAPVGFSQQELPQPQPLVGGEAVPPGAIVLDGAAPGTMAADPSPVAVAPSSAIVVPAPNRDFAWDQIVDVVDDYFEIEQEDRVKLVGDVLTEGRIDTFPLTGATLLEPWRGDSVNLYERLESTLQSMRRTAYVRVIPDAGGYVVDVTVLKELEDVPRPIQASTGAATFRYDTSLQRDTEFSVDPNRIPGDPARPNSPRVQTAGWIPQGRDPALEQEMLAKIAARLSGVAVR